MSNAIQNIQSKVQAIPLPTKFCYFLPLRIGLFSLASIGLIGSTILASLSWLQVLTKLPFHRLNREDTTGLYLHTTLFTTLAVTFIILLPIAFLRLRRAALGYSITLACLLIASVCSGSYTMYAIYKPNTRRRIEFCMGKAKDQATREMCTNGLAMSKGVAIAIYILAWLILSYTILMVYAFTRELMTEMDDPSLPTTQIRGRNVGNPAPLTMYNSFGAAGHNTGYAFSSVDNSFGRGVGIRAVPMAV